MLDHRFAWYESVLDCLQVWGFSHLWLCCWWRSWGNHLDCNRGGTSDRLSALDMKTALGLNWRVTLWSIWSAAQHVLPVIMKLLSLYSRRKSASKRFSRPETKPTFTTACDWTSSSENFHYAHVESDPISSLSRLKILKQDSELQSHMIIIWSRTLTSHFFYSSQKACSGTTFS